MARKAQFGKFAGILIIALGAAPAHAESSASYAGGTAKATSPWMSSDVAECGQSCNYQKANENLGLQAEYAVVKLTNLGLQKKNGADMGDEMKKEVPGFCLQNEGGDACFDRYKALQIEHLRSMRTAILTNNTSIKSLMSQVTYVDGTKVGGAVTTVPRAEQKKPILPYVVTYQDVLKDNSHLQYLASPAYEREKNKIPTCPGKEAFVKQKTIYRDPDDKDKGTIEVIDTDAQGNVAYKPGYEAAIAKCQQDRQALEAKIKGLNLMPMSAPAKPGDDIGDTSKLAFKQSRMAYIDAANEVISGQKREKPKVETSNSFQNLVKTGMRSNMVVDFPGNANVSAATAATNTRKPAASPAAALTGNEQVMAAPPDYVKKTQDLYIAYPPARIDQYIDFINNDFERPSKAPGS